MAFRAFDIAPHRRRFTQLLRDSIESFAVGPSAVQVLRILLATILLFAAVLKTHAIWQSVKPLQELTATPGWAVVASIFLELILGLWLLSGRKLAAAWIASIICYTTFLCFSIRAALSGAADCGCFGFLATSPWLTCSLDAAVLLALIAFRTSFTNHDLISARRGSRAPFRIATFGLTVVAAGVLFGKGIAAQFGRFYPAVPQSTADVVNPFLGAVASGTCDANCLEETISTTRALLGLDPVSPDTRSLDDLESLFQRLRVEAQEVGSKIDTVPAEQVLAEVSPGLVQPVVLVGDNHLFLLLGALNINGEIFCEVIHGNSPMALVSINDVRRAHLKEAWKLDCHNDGVPINIGPSEEIRIDSILHNYGEVAAGTDATCKFTLTNVGSLPIHLDRARTSCGCTATDLLEPLSIPPGGASTIAVSMRMSGAASARETVTIPTSVEGGKHSREIKLQLLACHRESKEIVPKTLDFGTVEPGKTYLRMVRMTEVPSDRFQISDVAFNGTPLVSSVERILDKDDLAT